MNATIEAFARKTLKMKLAECSKDQHHRFKQMYANGNLELPIDIVVDKMPSYRLDWAMTQVETTFQKKKH